MGQAPSRDTQGRPPFSGRSGRRLAELAGIAPEHLFWYFDVANLVGYWPGKNGHGDAFPRKVARELAARTVIAHDRVVFVGRNVATAFRCEKPFPGYCRWFDFLSGERVIKAAVIPHPSGVNRWYNDGGNEASVQDFLRTLVQVKVEPHGRGDGQEEMFR